MFWSWAITALTWARIYDFVSEGARESEVDSESNPKMGRSTQSRYVEMSTRGFERERTYRWLDHSQTVSWFIEQYRPYTVKKSESWSDEKADVFRCQLKNWIRCDFGRADTQHHLPVIMITIVNRSFFNSADVCGPHKNVAPIETHKQLEWRIDLRKVVQNFQSTHEANLYKHR